MLGNCALGALLGSVPVAAAAQDEPICADRPGKANGTCTVPTGRLQVETGFVSWSRDREDGLRLDELSIGETAFKLGLTDRSHIELNVVPYASSKARGVGQRDRASGFGDLTFRYKHRLTSDAAPVAVAASPFVKLPTASRSIGNGKIEGGVAIPIGYALSDVLDLTLGPELDIVVDADGSGRHFALVNVASLSAPLLPRVSISGEIWNALDFDPSGTTPQWSADASLAWLVTDVLQLDIGVNVGLNRNAPDIEIYAGIASRFP